MSKHSVIYEQTQNNNTKDQGLVQAPQLNAGRKRQKNVRKSVFLRKKIQITLKKYIFLDIPYSYAKIMGEKIFTHGSLPEVGEK